MGREQGILAGLAVSECLARLQANQESCHSLDPSGSTYVYNPDETRPSFADVMNASLRMCLYDPSISLVDRVEARFAERETEPFCESDSSRERDPFQRPIAPIIHQEIERISRELQRSQAEVRVLRYSIPPSTEGEEPSPVQE